jgi:hypothetical protein
MAEFYADLNDYERDSDNESSESGEDLEPEESKDLLEEDDDIFIPEQPKVVGVFRDRERAGMADVLLGTDIAGGGHLAELAERINRMNPDVRLISGLEKSFRDLAQLQIYSLRRHDLDHLKTIIYKLPHRHYKNPLMLVLGYILQRTIEQHGISIVRKLILQSRISGVSETDVIRYYRLLQMDHLL